MDGDALIIWVISVDCGPHHNGVFDVVSNVLASVNLFFGQQLCEILRQLRTKSSTGVWRDLHLRLPSTPLIELIVVVLKFASVGTERIGRQLIWHKEHLGVAVALAEEIYMQRIRSVNIHSKTVAWDMLAASWNFDRALI